MASGSFCLLPVSAATTTATARAVTATIGLVRSIPATRTAPTASTFIRATSASTTTATATTGSLFVPFALPQRNNHIAWHERYAND